MRMKGTSGVGKAAAGANDIMEATESRVKHFLRTFLKIGQFGKSFRTIISFRYMFRPSPRLIVQYLIAVHGVTPATRMQEDAWMESFFNLPPIYFIFSARYTR